MIAIGPARIRIDGREMRSNVVNVRVGAGAAPRRARRASGARPRREPVTRRRGQPATRRRRGASNFIRAVPDKVKAFVGEQVTVSW